MEIGISTASLFLREYNEDALTTLNEIDAKVAEVFLSAFCEYTPEFGKILKERQGNLKIHSVHTLTSHIDPDLFSLNKRAKDDAFKILTGVMGIAQTLGAKYYTFHGKSRMKKGTLYNNYDNIAEGFTEIIDFCEKFGVSLCLENVEWAFYNKVGFYGNVKKFCPKLKGVLDVKQARISGDSYKDYIEEMGSDIMTVHLSDVDENGKIVLPGKGIFDFSDLFRRLKGVGFDNDMLIEVYKNDYNEISELKESLDYLRELKDKIF